MITLVKVWLVIVFVTILVVADLVPIVLLLRACKVVPTKLVERLLFHKHRLLLVLVHIFRRFRVVEVTWLLIPSFLAFKIRAHTSTATSAFSFDAKVSRFSQLLGLNESRLA